jgi:hypothetical protein
MEIHVGISKRSASHSVSADTDRCDGADAVKDLEQDTLRNVGVQITDVEGGRLERSGLSGLKHFDITLLKVI